MSRAASEKNHPSVEEFKGWYNLGYDRHDGHPVLNSAKWLPGFEHGEFFHLYIAERDWFEKQLVLPSVRKPFDPLLDPPFFVRSDADDRTLDIDPDFEYLTVGMLRRIQEEFLGRHPLWRVILIAEHPSCSIVIYPDAIRFGNLPLGVDPHDALRELVPRAVALREKRLRPQRAQIAYLEKHLPEAVRAIGNQLFLVFGVLDNYEGNYSRSTICAVVRGSDKYAVQVEAPPGAGNDFLWSTMSYCVNEEGKIISDEMKESVPYCAALWLIPAEYRGPLAIVEEASGNRHIYELKSENIFRTLPANP